MKSKCEHGFLGCVKVKLILLLYLFIVLPNRGEASNTKLSKIVITKDIVIIIIALLAFLVGLYQTIDGIIQETKLYDITRRCNGGLGYRYHGNVSVDNNFISETSRHEFETKAIAGI